MNPPDLQLWLHPTLIPAWVIIGVFIAEAMLPISARYHPLTIIRILADRMAARVHPSTQRSVSQQRISGALGFIVLLTPLILIVALFTHVVEFPHLFDAIVLFFACEFRTCRRQMQRIIHALEHEHKSLARDLLSTFVLRQTNTLSPLGIGKASLESMLLRFSYQVIAPVFWYLLFGAVAALSYRMLYEVAQMWNRQQLRFIQYGAPIRWTVNLLQWLPNHVAVFIAAIAGSPRGVLSSRKPSAPCLRAKLLAKLGGALEVELGGPAFYDGIKQRLSKVGGTRQVVFSDLHRGLQSVLRMQMVCAVLVLLFCAIHYGARHL
ncbi:cobalamin biosynthesis protein CobD/CbiB [Aestuariibacter salexigens]|uniref:cobalamin biosynthesis protein CobD/CbiB n=1 Tax=Aestuariibacter salexigens TaxID=226010 RepID=UPI0006881C07|nr:cobalamin biosynthesis protein [Aestuariibacter salexigens]